MSPISNIKTFTLGDKGKEFVAGLLWLPIAGDSKNVKDATRKLSVEQNVDLVVYRKVGIMQVGLAGTHEGARAGQCSAAAIVSKTIEVESGLRNVLVATQIPDGHWLYVAQRDAVILPDGDWIGDEDNVRARLLHDNSVGEWDRIYAPEHWGIGGSEERDFLSFLPKGKNNKVKYHRWWQLEPIKFNLGGLKRFILPLVVLATAAVLIQVFWTKWNQQQLADEMAKLAALKSSQETQPKIIPPPWPTMHKAKTFVDACEQVIGSTSFWPGGWTLQDIKCVGNTVTASWIHEEGGRESYLREILPNVKISADGGSVTLAVPLSLPKLNQAEEVAPDLEASKTRLRFAAERYAFDLKLTQEAAAPALPGGQQPKQLEIKNWQTINWTVSKTLLRPSEVVKLLDGPAFRLNSVQMVIVNGAASWNLEGVQYAKK